MKQKVIHFYYPNKVSETGEIIFDTKLIKIKTSINNGKKFSNKQ